MANHRMKPRISVITLGVNDLETSLAFYRDGLGLPTTGIKRGCVRATNSGKFQLHFSYMLHTSDRSQQ